MSINRQVAYYPKKSNTCVGIVTMRKTKMTYHY